MVGQIEEPHSMTIYGELGTLRLAQGRLMLAGEDGIWYDQTPTDTIEAPGSGGRYNEFERGTVYLGQALKLALAGDTNALRIAATFEDGLFIQQTLDAVRQGL
jgi:predicted dehydrogenase